MNHTKLLEKVMERLKKQFLVPAVFTLKEHPLEEDLAEVNVFIHGLNTGFASSMDFLLEQATGAKEDIRKINMIADYLIHYFIERIKVEEEEMTILEVIENLDYLYEIKVKAHYVDAMKKENVPFRLVAFVIEEGESKHIVLMDASQMKREYEGRFESIDAPDILVDLKEIFNKLETLSYEEAAVYTESLGRNISLLNNEESRSLVESLESLEKQDFLSSIGLR